MPAPFVILVPVKPPGIGKSRLAGLGDPVRRSLALAFAQDTVAAVCRAAGVAAVVVVTSDPEVGAGATAAGCAVVPDAGELNAALRAAARWARPRWPDAAPVAVCGDLPALRPGELELALAGLPADRPAFVCDAGGSGTTLYAAAYDRFTPAFGPGSAAAHRDAGAYPLPGDLSGLRCDVDEPGDLDRAGILGLGPSTAAAVAAAQLSAHNDAGGPPTGDPPA